MRYPMAAVLGLVLVAALAGCGRKGPLELPPGAEPAKAEAPAEQISPEENEAGTRAIESEMRKMLPRNSSTYRRY
tara:strand:- start:12827 stop:13051 length:225 start_codon:yes stop_codon:yes gene_type:complete